MALPSLGRLPLAETSAKADDEDESGLTRALKNASLVPTGACLPRGFDPDYCAYDGYYAIGVAVVSAVVGALVDADVPNKILMSMYAKASNALGDFCHKRPTDAYSVWMGNIKPFSQMDTFDQIRAMENFPMLCNSLDEAMKPMIDGKRFFPDQKSRSLAYDRSRNQKTCKYWEMYREKLLGEVRIQLFKKRYCNFNKLFWFLSRAKKYYKICKSI